MNRERTKARLKLYPPNWKAIVASVRVRDGNRCACFGHCGLDHGQAHGFRCGVPNSVVIRRFIPAMDIWLLADNVAFREAPPTGQWRSWGKPFRVILTTAHLCQDPSCADETHLLSCCQLCHLRIDRFVHAQHAAETRERKRHEAAMAAGQGELFGGTS